MYIRFLTYKIKTKNKGILLDFIVPTILTLPQLVLFVLQLARKGIQNCSIFDKLAIKHSYSLLYTGDLYLHYLTSTFAQNPQMELVISLLEFQVLRQL